jgi:hypothetical protein
MGVLSAASWRSTVARHFRFLEEDLHMSVIATDDTTNWETSVTYGSDLIAVIIRYSVEFDRAEVELIRLVDRSVPSVPIFIHPDTRIDRSLLDNLLFVRAPSEAEKLKTLGGLDSKSVDRSLAFQAAALQLHGMDFLNGNLDVFNDLDGLIKGRIATNPQKITISFPEGTSKDEVDQEVAKAQMLDPKVPVEVKFYRRPAAPKAPRKWPRQKRSSG